MLLLSVTMCVSRMEVWRKVDTGNSFKLGWREQNDQIRLQTSEMFRRDVGQYGVMHRVVDAAVRASHVVKSTT